VDVRLRFKEKKLIDFRGKLYLVGRCYLNPTRINLARATGTTTLTDPSTNPHLVQLSKHLIP